MVPKKYNFKKALTSGCNCVGRKHGDERLAGYENLFEHNLNFIKMIKSSCEIFFEEFWDNDPQKNPYEECLNYIENYYKIELKVDDEKVKDSRYLFSYKNVDFFIMDNNEVYYNITTNKTNNEAFVEISNIQLLKQLQKAFKNFQDYDLSKNPNETFMAEKNIEVDDLLKMALIKANCDAHGKSTNKHKIIKTWISIDDVNGNTIYDTELEFDEEEFHREIINKAISLGFLCKHSLSKRDYYFFCDSPNEFLWENN